MSLLSIFRRKHMFDERQAVLISQQESIDAHQKDVFKEIQKSLTAIIQDRRYPTFNRLKLFYFDSWFLGMPSTQSRLIIITDNKATRGLSSFRGEPIILMISCPRSFYTSEDGKSRNPDKIFIHSSLKSEAGINLSEGGRYHDLKDVNGIVRMASDFISGYEVAAKKLNKLRN